MLVRLVLVVLVTVPLAMLTACGVGARSAPVTNTAAPAPSPAQCAAVERIAPSPGSRSTVLLVDGSSSMASTDPPPAVVERLAAAQRAGDGLVVLAVEGVHRTPRVVVRVALDPEPGKDSPNAANARRIVLGCVPEWAVRATPTAEGTALLEALDAAGRLQPDLVLVWSDGVATGGVLDLATLGYDVDPGAVVEAARTAGQLPPLHDVAVVWVGLGDTTDGLPRPERDHLQALFAALATASGATSVQFDARPGAARAPAAAPSALPADPVPPPGSGRIAVPGGGSCYRLPEALLFAPGSDVPGPGAAAAVAPAVRELAAHPAWVADVLGHAADYETAAERQRISTARAQAIAAVLRTSAGPIEPGRVVATGVGATRPLVDEWHDGVHDEAAAARNRRVEVVVHPAGSAAVCGG